MNRRGLLIGAAASLLAAPSIVRTPGVLMRTKPVIRPDQKLVKFSVNVIPQFSEQMQNADWLMAEMQRELMKLLELDKRPAIPYSPDGKLPQYWLDAQQKVVNEILDKHVTYKIEVVT